MMPSADKITEKTFTDRSAECQSCPLIRPARRVLIHSSLARNPPNEKSCQEKWREKITKNIPCATDFLLVPVATWAKPPHRKTTLGVRAKSLVYAKVDNLACLLLFLASHLTSRWNGRRPREIIAIKIPEVVSTGKEVAQRTAAVVSPFSACSLTIMITNHVSDAIKEKVWHWEKIENISPIDNKCDHKSVYAELTQARNLDA